MMKNLFLGALAVVLATALLTAPALAVTEILYSFEGSEEGWAPSDQGGTQTAVDGGTGATDGTYSLRVAGAVGHGDPSNVDFPGACGGNMGFNNPCGPSFARHAQVDLGASQLASLNKAAANGGSISFDMTIDLDEFHSNLPFLKSQIVVNTDAGWTQRDLMEGNPLPPNTQDPVLDLAAGRPDVQTLHFDIPLSELGAAINGANTSARIVLATNSWDELFPPQGITERVVHLDNFAVNFVPEPATITSAVVMLLGASVVRRRRMK